MHHSKNPQVEIIHMRAYNNNYNDKNSCNLKNNNKLYKKMPKLKFKIKN